MVQLRRGPCPSLDDDKKQIFAESPEMEAFSLLESCSLAIYLPGTCQLFPQYGSLPGAAHDSDVMVGVCSGNHYFLAVPKEWIKDGANADAASRTAPASSGMLINTTTT